MADRVFFAADSPDDFIRGMSVPPQMIADLRTISAISLPVIEQIGIAVEGATGFLDDARLEALVRKAISEERAADALLSALRNLRPSSVAQTLNALEEWRRKNPRHVEDFSDEAFASIRVALPRLIRPSAAIEREKKTPVEPAEPEHVDPESRCEAVITSLQRRELSHEERRKLILEAEVLPFRGRLAAELTPLLKRFIEEYRRSDVPVDQVAVGSAIRNYVATAPVGDACEASASLLKVELKIPIVLEVEVTKMVVRKLTANPPAQRDQYPELASRLEEIVDDYARPRLLGREKYGAVALNAILGLVLTRSGRYADVVERIRTVHVAWFHQLLARRAARLRTDLVARDQRASFADIAEVLERLSSLDSPSTHAVVVPSHADLETGNRPDRNSTI